MEDESVRVSDVWVDCERQTSLPRRRSAVCAGDLGRGGSVSRSGMEVRRLFKVPFFFLNLLVMKLRIFFPSYVDAELVQWQALYYGPHYPRLQKIKRAVDPCNLFRFPQSIQG